MSPVSPHEKVWLHTDGRAVVEPPADVDVYSVPQLRADLATAASLSKNGDIVLEFTRLVFFDSSGLGALIAAYKRAHERSPRAHVYLVGVPDRVAAVLRITGTARFFRTAPTLADLPIVRETQRCV